MQHKNCDKYEGSGDHRMIGWIMVSAMLPACIDHRGGGEKAVLKDAPWSRNVIMYNIGHLSLCDYNPYGVDRTEGQDASVWCVFFTFGWYFVAVSKLHTSRSSESRRDEWTTFNVIPHGFLGLNDEEENS